MKMYLITIMCSLLLMAPFVVQAQADYAVIGYTEEDLPNGDYIITALEEL